MKYIKLYEHKYYIDSLINWDLINDAKDMALEYIDEGFTLYLFVLVGEKYRYNSKAFRILNLEFDHNTFTVNKDYTYSTELAIKRIKNMETKYEITLMNYHNVDNPKYLDGSSCRELINRLKSAYPNENIIDG